MTVSPTANCRLSCGEGTFYSACIVSCLFHVHQRRII